MGFLRRLLAVFRRPAIEPDRLARAMEIWHGAPAGAATCPGCHDDARRLVAIYEAIG